MKLKPTLTQQQISNATNLNKPNPPKEEDVKKAKFIDKTFAWRNDARI